MAPIPIALCGKHPDMADDFIKGMLPEYDVVHVCHSAPIAISELVPLLAGEVLEPCSGLGSNNKSPTQQIPKAIFCGGGFCESELKEMRAVPALCKVPWMWPPTHKRPKEAGTAPPPIRYIIEAAKKGFEKHGLVEGKEESVEGADGALWECM